MVRCITTLALACAIVAGGHADFADTLEIFTDGWPRAFFFRASEGFATNPRIGYERWEETFERLQGIEGKVLDEEVPGRSKYNVEFFTRFKENHPRQLVLLHYNGEARDPRDGTEEYFAGHWVYYNGCRIVEDVPAETGVSEIKVEDAQLFRTEMGRYGDKNEDVGLCVLDEEGKPDWRRSEQVEVLSVDRERNVLRVGRGCFGTEPRQFEGGGSYAAAHLCSGPWGRRSNLQWVYNYSTHCPRDEQGQSCVDVLVDEFARNFEAGGRLESFDGVEFDVMFYQRWNPRGGGRRGPDADGDGEADNGIVDGVNTYGIGTYEFCQRLRERLGDDILLLADGHGQQHQRAVGQLNGIESEGWPTLSDWEFEDWSGGLNRHLYWERFGREPSFSYFNHKWVDFGEGERRRPPVPFSRHRLVFAAAHFTDAAITYSFRPPNKEGVLFPIWDELWKGTEQELGWLGEPIGPSRRLALDAPDVLGGAGSNWPDSFIERFGGADIEIERAERGIRIRPTDAETGRIVFRLRDVPCDGPDLFVQTTMRAAAMAGYPVDIPRASWVGVARPGGYLVDQHDPPEAGMCVRGGEERELDRRTGAGVRYVASREAGGETREAYFCHPPWRDGKTGYTFWQREVRVPEDGVLRFSIAMGELSPERSDGVVFTVLLRPENGQWQSIFQKRYNEYRWEDHEVDLDDWAGERVTLRFVTDAGPNDDSTTDHSAWGAARVEPADAPQEETKPVSYMTFSGGEAFTSTFAFRRVRTDTIDLRFVIESPEPVWLEEISVHAAADRIVREYDNGAVLANPSYHAVEFNIGELFGGRRFRRLRGSESQDPEFNDGQAVGERLTLGERDAIFLVEAEE